MPRPCVLVFRCLTKCICKHLHRSQTKQPWSIVRRPQTAPTPHARAHAHAARARAATRHTRSSIGPHDRPPRPHYAKHADTRLSAHTCCLHTAATPRTRRVVTRPHTGGWSTTIRRRCHWLCWLGWLRLRHRHSRDGRDSSASSQQPAASSGHATVATPSCSATGLARISAQRPHPQHTTLPLATDAPV